MTAITVTALSESETTIYYLNTFGSVVMGQEAYVYQVTDITQGDETGWRSWFWGNLESWLYNSANLQFELANPHGIAVNNQFVVIGGTQPYDWVMTNGTYGTPITWRATQYARWTRNGTFGFTVPAGQYRPGTYANNWTKWYRDWQGWGTSPWGGTMYKRIIFTQWIAGTLTGPEPAPEPQCLIRRLTFEDTDTPHLKSHLKKNTNIGGGLALNPDSLDLNDEYLRRVVNVRAEVTGTEETHFVYFKSFDVDDPSADGPPLDDERFVQDNKDNVNPKAGWFVTGARIEGRADTVMARVRGRFAEVQFEVTWQPGDNFRIVAVCDDVTLLDNLTPLQSTETGEVITLEGERIPSMTLNDDERQIAPPPAVRMQSVMLTVWRWLHLEVDSMEAVPTTGAEKNLVEGTILEILSLANTPLAGRISVDQPLDDGSPMLPDGNGRFENGRLYKSSSLGDVLAGGVEANGDRNVRNTTTGFLIYCTFQKPGLPSVDAYVYIHTSEGKKRWGVIPFPGEPPLTSDYAGGIMMIDGQRTTVKSIEGTVVKVRDDITIPFKLYDDDVAEMPYTTEMFRANDLPLLKEKYGTAYLYPLLDGGGRSENNEANVPFDLNVNSAKERDVALGSHFQSEPNRKDGFWIAHVMMAYQGPKTGRMGARWIGYSGSDNDPDSEAGLGGVTKTDRSSFIFLETVIDDMRDMPAIVPEYRQNVIIHEIGHQFALDHTGDQEMTIGGILYNNIMLVAWKANAIFFPEHLNTIRSSIRGPGR